MTRREGIQIVDRGPISAGVSHGLTTWTMVQASPSLAAVRRSRLGPCRAAAIKVASATCAAPSDKAAPGALVRTSRTASSCSRHVVPVEPERLPERSHRHARPAAAREHRCARTGEAAVARQRAALPPSWESATGQRRPMRRTASATSGRRGQRSRSPARALHHGRPWQARAPSICSWQCRPTCGGAASCCACSAAL